MQSHRILMVKNNRLLCESLREYFRSQGFDWFQYVVDGSQGLEIVKDIKPENRYFWNTYAKYECR